MVHPACAQFYYYITYRSWLCYIKRSVNNVIPEVLEWSVRDPAWGLWSAGWLLLPGLWAVPLGLGDGRGTDGLPGQAPVAGEDMDKLPVLVGAANGDPASPWARCHLDELGESNDKIGVMFIFLEWETIQLHPSSVTSHTPLVPHTQDRNKFPTNIGSQF